LSWELSPVSSSVAPSRSGLKSNMMRGEFSLEAVVRTCCNCQNLLELFAGSLVLFGVLISVFGGLISGSDLENLRAQGSPPPQAFSGSEKCMAEGLMRAGSESSLSLPLHLIPLHLTTCSPNPNYFALSDWTVLTICLCRFIWSSFKQRRVRRVTNASARVGLRPHTTLL
jgi:hypothetical protein